MIEGGGELRHAVLLHQRKYPGRDGSDTGVKPEHYPGLALYLLFAVRIDQQRERHPVGTGRCLHNVRQIPLILSLIEVLELFPRKLLMTSQVEVTAIVNALDLLPAKRKLILNVERGLRVVGELAPCVLMPLQLCGGEAQRPMPLHAPLAPALEPFSIGSRLHEELHLHLLEFPGSEDEVAG